MSDDPARTTDQASPGQQLASVRGPALPYVQLMEAEATPLDAGEALERADEYGRVPVLVRIRRQPPINPAWILVAIGLAASGLFLPLVAALRAMIIVAAVAAPGGRSAVAAVHPGPRRHPLRWSRRPAGTTASCPRATAGSSPLLALSHVVTTREIAFDVPVTRCARRTASASRWTCCSPSGSRTPPSSPTAITPSDADQFVQASCQDAVRTLVRGIGALALLDARCGRGGLRCAASSTPSSTPTASTSGAWPSPASPCPRRSPIPSRHAGWHRSSWPSRRRATRSTSGGSPTRPRWSPRRRSPGGPRWSTRRRPRSCAWPKLEERIAANPNAARYDLESARLRIAEQRRGQQPGRRRAGRRRPVREPADRARDRERRRRVAGRIRDRRDSG